MKGLCHSLGLWGTAAFAVAILLGAGACSRKTGIEGGFEYAAEGWGTELTRVVQNEGEAGEVAETGPKQVRLEVPSRLGGKRVRRVAAGAFRNTDAVSVKLPWRVSEIGAEAFAGCTNLVWAELPSRLERVEDGLFRGCIRLAESDLPDRVEEIGAWAYGGCRCLKRVALPAKLRSLGDHVFSGCAMLESVELPDGIADIPDGAFEGCRGLKSVRIPVGVTNIGARAFAGCASLEEIELPAGLRSVGDEAFADCTGLQSVEVAEGNPVFSVRDGVLFRGGGTELVLFPRTRGGAYAVPEGVERIAPGAFRGSRVEEVKVPGGVETIAESAFRDCRSLRRVTLDAGTRELGGSAFMGCSALWAFTMPGSLEKAGGDLFAGCGELSLLVVPDDLVPSLESWQVPDSCTTYTRSAWEEKRKGKRPGSAVAPFCGLFEDEDLDTVAFEGTVLVASALPDPDKNDYDDCLYALLVELDSVLSTTPPSTNVEQVVLVNVPVMEGRSVIRENVFEPGDKIACTCAAYDDMPQGILEIQLSDDIQSFEHQQYYPLRIKKIAEFQTAGSRTFAKREISILPIRALPRDANAAAARRERIRKEIARIEGELALHGGSFEAWKEEYKPIAERYGKLCEERHAGWTGDSYFAASGPETAYKTQEYIEGILPYKKHLEKNNIDLIVVRVPSKWDFAARVLAADDFRENPAWTEHYYECLKNDIEIIDPMPEMWKERFDFPLFYFYNCRPEYHPFEGFSFVAAKEIAKVLERYPFQKAEQEIVLEDVVFESVQDRYFWPGGNGKFDPSENLSFKQVVQNGGPIGKLDMYSGSPFLFASSSYFWYPQRNLGASVPGYTAYFLQAIPDWFYQDGGHNRILTQLVRNPDVLHSRRAVVMAGPPGDWNGFPPLPEYIQDGARRMTLEKNMFASSEAITLHDHDAFMHSADENGALWFESNAKTPDRKESHFDMDFEIPDLEGKKGCMIRVNIERTSHLAMDFVETGSDVPLDMAFLPPGRVHMVDFFVPLPEPTSPVTVRFFPRDPEKGLLVTTIELWYY